MFKKEKSLKIKTAMSQLLKLKLLKIAMGSLSKLKLTLSKSNKMQMERFINIIPTSLKLMTEFKWLKKNNLPTRKIKDQQKQLMKKVFKNNLRLNKERKMRKQKLFRETK